VDILTAEHWALLSTRSLGYQEMFGRANIFVAVLSGIVVALALLAQATGFGRVTLIIAILLVTVALLIGVATFVRSVAINQEDARWVAGMNRLREAYVEIVPELEEYFTRHGADAPSLAHGAPQRMRNIASSLTTTSGVIATLNSVLAGALASGGMALATGRVLLVVAIGVGVSLASGVLHTRYAAHFRREHPLLVRRRRSEGQDGADVENQRDAG
jgi:hypothetical protein